MKRFLLLCILLVIVGLSVFEFLNLEREKKPCFVEEREVVKAVYGSGNVRSKKQVLVKSPVSGYVREIYADEGDRVREGSLLALIESSGLSSKIEALSRKIELLENRLREGSDFRKRLEVELEVKRVNLINLQRKYTRRKELFKKGVIPEETLEEYERLLKLAHKELDATETKVRDTLLGMEKELEALEREKEALEKELDRYKIRSPIEGIVLKRFVEEGDYMNHLSMKNVMFSVGSEDREVVLKVDEEFSPLIEVGQEVLLRSDAFPDRTFKGFVSSVSLESDTSKRLVEVKVDAQIPSKIPVNSLVEGNVIVEKRKAKVIPVEAVREGYAEVRDGDRWKRLKVWKVYGNYAEVLRVPVGSECLIEEK